MAKIGDGDSRDGPVGDRDEYGKSAGDGNRGFRRWGWVKILKKKENFIVEGAGGPLAAAGEFLKIKTIFILKN